jgi:hypothetical protein
MNYKEIVNEINILLSDNILEWERRYDGYLKLIKEKEEIYRSKKFRVIYPLSLYTSISRIENFEYDIRFCGQSIATVTVNDDVLVSTKGKDPNNKKYFHVDISLENKKTWRDRKASEFRGKFTKELRNIVKLNSPEHNVENVLLEEFAKTGSVDKTLCNIQPIKLCGAFFQMPTPLSASKEPINYSAHNRGGGIDILARVTHNIKDVRICVMEIKDENKKGESPQKVMEQAVAYATFVARLLRSKSGNDWYKMFGFRKSIPKNLEIDVAIVMPFDEDRNENFEKIEKIKVSENTYLNLYSLYYKTIENNVHEFWGSLKDNIFPHNK